METSVSPPAVPEKPQRFRVKQRRCPLLDPGSDSMFLSGWIGTIVKTWMNLAILAGLSVVLYKLAREYT